MPPQSVPTPKPTENILKSTSLTNIEKAKLLFPDFEPNKKLRFSRLFDSGFGGRDLDRDWKYGKKKKKYKHPIRENGLWTKVLNPCLKVSHPYWFIVILSKYQYQNCHNYLSYHLKI